MKKLIVIIFIFTFYSAKSFVGYNVTDTVFILFPGESKENGFIKIKEPRSNEVKFIFKTEKKLNKEQKRSFIFYGDSKPLAILSDIENIPFFLNMEFFAKKQSEMGSEFYKGKVFIIIEKIEKEYCLYNLRPHTLFLNLENDYVEDDTARQINKY